MDMMKTDYCKKIICNGECKLKINGLEVTTWCKKCVCLNTIPQMGCCRTYGNYCPNQYRKCKHRSDISTEMEKRGYGKMD